jgi:ubiquinone/menaquinone biosynthesis C-methylase UbiE
MQRVDAPEILDSDVCSREEAQSALAVLGRINRWFGGVATTQRMIERVASATGARKFSVLEVAAGCGEVPAIVRRNLQLRGVTAHFTLLDLAPTHLPANHTHQSNDSPKHSAVVGDALVLPFADDAFDLVSCNLFTHHLCPQKLQLYLREALRVSRRAVLVNDLIRHPLHLALVYASLPLMWNRVAWLDGLTSVRRSYVPEEMRTLLQSTFSDGILERTEISQHYLFRMGVIVWKGASLEKPL